MQLESTLSLRTDPGLFAAIKEVAGRALTPREVREQRVSFVYGSVKEDQNMTKEFVRKVIEKQEGSAEQ